MKNQNEQLDNILIGVIIGVISSIIVAIIYATLRYLYNYINPKKLYNSTLENFEKDVEESIIIYYKYCDNPNLKEYQMSLKDKNKVIARKHIFDLHSMLFNRKFSFLFKRKIIKKNYEAIHENFISYLENSTGGQFESSNIINNEELEKTRKSSENLLKILKSSKI
jgi:hypothetical protein